MSLLGFLKGAILLLFLVFALPESKSVRPEKYHLISLMRFVMLDTDVAFTRLDIGV